MVYAKPAFLLLLTFVTTTYCVRQTAAPEVIKPTFSSNDARAVYAADLNDPWNRIFTLMTYSIHYFPPVPKTRVLKALDQEHTLHVARQKELREDFKSLFGVR